MEITGRLQWAVYNEVGECDSQGQIEIRADEITITERILTNRDVRRMNSAILRLSPMGSSDRLLASMRSLPQNLDSLLRPNRVVDIFLSKDIKLDDRFSLTYVETPASVSGGFGLSIKSAQYPLFCWEWFNVDGPGHATKLQESGELAFETISTDRGMQMSRMEFSTDVSIRAIKIGDDIREPIYRINIDKGSVIYWPV